jgi:hypothetical protein
MRGYRLILLLLLVTPLVSNAQYWFQYGARGGSESYDNSGAKVTIQTISTQNLQSGSMAFWVGETLSNGAFLQEGYLVTNQSGLYPSMCNQYGCSQSTYVSKDAPEWFYEYFTSSASASFMGAVGANDSAGRNGTLHTYGFYSKGDAWYFFMDNNTLGHIDLGTNTSGNNGPAAFAEIANTSNADTLSTPVLFSNLSAFKDGKFLPVPQGYSYIGYGVGSLSVLPDPYGVQEVGDRVNYFEAGSGLPQPPNREQLWQLGFSLGLLSQYGNLSGTNQYLAYKGVRISAPALLYLNQSSRVAFVQWEGSGVGSYSGTSPSQNITLFSNVTETANWNLQYLFNLTSQFGAVTGYGWHSANSAVDYSMNSSDVYSNRTARWNFDGWSNGVMGTNASIILSRPYSVYAVWQRQYLLNATSMFGGVNGSGWYDQNSIASLSLSNLYHNTSSEKRLAFYSWSTGNRSPDIQIPMNAPANVYAIFRNQSLVHLFVSDVYGIPVKATSFYVGNLTTNKSIFLFDDYTYNITKAYYKGMELQIDQAVNVSGPSNFTFSLPIYNVQISTTDVFGIPVNVSMSVTFLNGTTAYANSGAAGLMFIPDVPYGSAAVQARYGGETLTAQASQGSIAKITVVSGLDLTVFAIVVALGFLMYFVASHRIRHHNPRPRNK